MDKLKSHISDLGDVGRDVKSRAWRRREHGEGERERKRR
jgi:hypothetical protein